MNAPNFDLNETDKLFMLQSLIFEAKKDNIDVEVMAKISLDFR